MCRVSNGDLTDKGLWSHGNQMLSQIVTTERSSSDDNVNPANVTARHEDHFVDASAAAVGFVGRSRSTRESLKMIRLVAASRCNPVLIVGETGTGKEVAARAFHALRHADGAFVDINCAALTATLLESELFGHVRGAFTGADREKTGLLEAAGSGTIFLDEISEMPLELQAKLLRVLQERTFRKVGGVKDLSCQATIIATSNRDLKEEVREKRFRQDLYYRLNICPIRLSPLRCPDRREDIPVLAKYFLDTSTIRRDGKKVTALTQLAIEALARHDWPGNIRELRNVIERAVLLETTDKVGLSSIVIDSEGEPTGMMLTATALGDFSLEKAERELIARALQETDWQKTQAASLLGITRATLYAKVKQYNIQKDPARASLASGNPPVPATMGDL
jgi:transcriptional regulator with PAS, ATPase and Fis domain